MELLPRERFVNPHPVTFPGLAFSGDPAERSDLGPQSAESESQGLLAALSDRLDGVQNTQSTSN